MAYRTFKGLEFGVRQGMSLQMLGTSEALAAVKAEDHDCRTDGDIPVTRVAFRDRYLKILMDHLNT